MFNINNFKLLFLSVVLLFVSACEEHDHDHDEEHIDAEGFILESNGTEIYKQFEGAVVTDNLVLSIGDTLDVSIHFLDHDGEEIDHEDEEGEEDELVFEIVDMNIISIESEDHEEHAGHDHEHHELAFELIGLSSGETTFTLSLMHDGHSDFMSLPIDVTVNSGTFSCSGKQLCANSCCALKMYASK